MPSFPLCLRNDETFTQVEYNEQKKFLLAFHLTTIALLSIKSRLTCTTTKEKLHDVHYIQHSGAWLTLLVFLMAVSCK